MKFWVCFFMYCCLSISAQESLELWMSSLSARGRIEVTAKDAVRMQQLSFWSERSLRQLEADWRTVVPFQRGQRFKIRVDPRTEKVKLNQTWEQGALKQTLHLSENSIKEHSRELAEAFTRAMAFRVGLAAMPTDRKNPEWQVPDWLVAGSAHALLAGRSRQLFQGLVREFTRFSPPYPEQVTPGLQGQGAFENEAAAAILCRWAFQFFKPEELWSGISQGDFRKSETWTQYFPSVGTLRQMHQHWDVWWPEERNRLIAEYAMEKEANDRLQSEKVFIPAFYGLFMEEENRYQPIPFAGLEVYLEDPRFGMAMQEWILRLQRLRFRQSEEFNEQVEQLQEAGRLAIRAANAEGRKREKLWAEAVENF